MSSAARVLNPELYRRIRRAFGEVKVKNPGQERIAVTVLDVITEKPRLVVSQWGEEYRVRCCFCDDRHTQLSISYLWGQVDETGRPRFFLACCHNRKCLADRDNREELVERLNGRDGVLEEAEILPGKKPAPGPTPVQGAGEVTRLDRLERVHPANLYLRDLGLDGHKVGRVYKVEYCESSRFTLARGRLIVPVKQDDKLQGWQALSFDEPDEDDDAPRYFTSPGMKISRLLYNFDRAKAYETGVIVPEPLDVWAFGAMAVSPFGRPMSEAQRRLFLTVFYKRSAVLPLRTEEAGTAEMNETVRALTQGMSGQLAVVTLPRGKDAASLGRVVLREYVNEKARAQRVRVRYKKVTT